MSRNQLAERGDQLVALGRRCARSGDRFWLSYCHAIVGKHAPQESVNVLISHC